MLPQIRIKVANRSNDHRLYDDNNLQLLERSILHLGPIPSRETPLRCKGPEIESFGFGDSAPKWSRIRFWLCTADTSWSLSSHAPHMSLRQHSVVGCAKCTIILRSRTRLHYHLRPRDCSEHSGQSRYRKLWRPAAISTVADE